jgi:hypothetical protein
MKSCRFLLFLLIITSLAACKKKEEPLFYESSRVEAPVKEPSREVVATQQAFIAAAKKLTPSVVNISTISKKKIIRPSFDFSPFEKASDQGSSSTRRGIYSPMTMWSAMLPP